MRDSVTCEVGGMECDTNFRSRTVHVTQKLPVRCVLDTSQMYWFSFFHPVDLLHLRIFLREKFLLPLSVRS